jgi:hypothetical protein
MEGATSTGPETVYAPGACNIGADEVAYRNKVGWLGVAIAVALVALLFIVSAPFWTFILVALPVYLAAVGFIQAQESFCVRYAAESVYNVGSGLGNHQKVSDDIAHAADMAKAKSIHLRCGAISLAVAVVLGAISAAVG